MTTLEYKLVDSYFERLKSLSNEAKLHLIHRLTAEEVIDEIRSSRTSASRKEEDAALLDKINGAWADDDETES